jgi:CHAT domain-containing protein
VRAALARGEPPAEDDLGRLSSALLPADLAPAMPLRIAPDATLFYLPFALLPDPARPGRRLVDERALRMTPSLSVLARLHVGAVDPRWCFAALASPAVDPPAREGGPAGAGALLAARYGLPPLPGSAREARSAADRLGEPSVVDVAHEATESRFFARASEGVRVLHVGAHTLIDESLDEGVAIFLAVDPAIGDRPDGATRSTDGRVTPAEIARGRVAADLVVLSGCRTAVPSDDGRGRALSSLSGALLAAGARGVIASLWEVGDAATAVLMEQFYFELARGVEPAEALRLAQARMAGDPRWSAPHLWAAFVVAGDPPPLPSRRWDLVPGAIAALLLIGGALLWRHGRRAAPTSMEIDR